MIIVKNVAVQMLNHFTQMDMPSVFLAIRISLQMERVKKVTTTMSLQGEARALRRRGLTEKICQKYKIFRDGENLRHYYYSKGWCLTGL